ncbi:MAG: trypsin-like peptidase domain-containing protein, partial [Pirellulaceae bacterium]
RLKVEDPNGNSFGSGTIVHRQGEDALVLTCAHIFRDSQGQGKINVDIFPPSGQQTVIGQIITYDLDRDVALVAIRTAAKVAVMPLGSRDSECQVGQTVFSIGCDQGGDRRLHDSRVNTVNRYQGPANVQVAGAPIDGRSGGGLFAADGQVVGVCNAADPEDDEGLYAAIPTIYEVLEQAKLAELFKDQSQSPAPTNLAQDNSRRDSPAPRGLPAGNPAPSQAELANHPRSAPLNVASADPGRSPLAMASNPAPANPANSANPAASTGSHSLSQVEQEILDYLQAQNGSAEVTVVLRNRDNPSAQPAVFSLPSQPSPEFLQQISGQPQSNPRPAQTQDGMILRGQNR